MPFPLPFKGIERRVIWLRGVLLGACFFGMIASAPVWFNSRSYPLSPITSWFPILPAPWDKVWFAAMLLALVLAAWFYRPSVIFFLSASFIAFCEDQNRGQPWFYMYWMMLLLTLFRAPVSMAACRVAISAAYIWSGIQKFNARFFQNEPDFFVDPARHWHLPAFVIESLRWSIAAAPFLELAIGLALWGSHHLRKAAVAAVLILHLMALLMLGPLGHNYNWVVWPWNLAMIGLVCALFLRLDPTPVPDSRKNKKQAPRKQIGLLRQTLAELPRSKPALIITALYSLLPLLSFYGKWDSDFSFSLYSDNQAAANIFVTEGFKQRVAPELLKYVQPFQKDYDPQHQGPYMFAFQIWCYDELHVPPFPEPRNFRRMFNFLKAYSRESEDLRMIVGQRGGPPMFFQGDSIEILGSL